MYILFLYKGDMFILYLQIAAGLYVMSDQTEVMNPVPYQPVRTGTLHI